MTSHRPWDRAALWMAGSSIFFLVIYRTCAWITGLRSDVGTLYFDWELRLPFVPLLIVPYWSIDVLFPISFFVCSTRDEVALLGRRTMLASLIGGSCFLAMPLLLGFPQPEVTGFAAPLFQLLRRIDPPVNLVPSLHIALGALVAGVFLRHSQGVARVVTGAWFGLIWVATVLTYQHHVVDVAGGFLLAWVCKAAIRPKQLAERPMPSRVESRAVASAPAPIDVRGAA